MNRKLEKLTQGQFLSPGYFEHISGEEVDSLFDTLEAEGIGVADNTFVASVYEFYAQNRYITKRQFNTLKDIIDVEHAQQAYGSVYDIENI